MNLNNLTHSDYPFNHWEFNNCLDEKTLNEISYSLIPRVNVLMMVRELQIIVGKVYRWQVKIIYNQEKS